MLKNISQSFLKHKFTLVLLLVFLLYLIITLPALFDADHVMKNLEPYPDGLLFALGARNFSLDRGLQLVSNLGQVNFWVPPLYSLYLSCFYLFSKSVIIFYVANLVLGLGTIFIINLIIRKTTKNSLSLITGFLIYFSHLIAFWLPSLAMTENISLFLFSLMVLGLIEKDGFSKILFVGVASIGLMLVRFSVFPVVLFSLLILVFQLKKKLLKYQKQIGILFILSVIILAYLINKGIIEVLTNTVLGALFDPQFFNFNFIIPNLIFYFKSLFFHQGSFLWLQLGLSSWPIILLFLTSLYFLWKMRKMGFWILLLLFFSLFPLQLVFYSSDSRYIIYLIILLSIAVAWLIDLIDNKKIVLFVVLIAGLINIFYQKNMLKQLIGDNWLGHSTAWQYQAINHFNQQLGDDDLIVTALPPFLVDAYQTKGYQVLPLSKSQEFLQKEMRIWGRQVNYDDLIAGYKQMLKNGKTLYISNAYVTHQQSVIADFEEFKSQFDMELVKEGCDQACNIYQLNLK